MSTSTNPNQTTAPNKLKLGWKETAQLGAIGVGAFFGINQGGAQTIGASVGEPLLHGTERAAAASADVVKGGAGALVEIATTNQPPENPAQDRFNEDMAQKYDLPQGH